MTIVRVSDLPHRKVGRVFALTIAAAVTCAAQTTWVGNLAPIAASDCRARQASPRVAGFPTRVYYVSLSGFDTHASQSGGRNYLLTGLGEALHGFQADLKRIGRDNDVSMVRFSEFGRRVEENASQGTDHGTAGPMFVMGKSVKPGLYGKHPSLTDLDGNGDLKMTTDFRRVYATMIDEWMGYKDTKYILKGDYQTLGIFG